MTPIQSVPAPETRPRQGTEMSDDVPADPDVSTSRGAELPTAVGLDARRRRVPG